MKKISVSLVSYSKLCCLLIIIGFLGGCASGINKSVTITEDDMARYSVMSAQEAVEHLGAALREAKTERLPLYTPSYYKEAEKLYSKALVSLEKKRDVVRDVAKADRLLARAKIKKMEVISELGDLFAIKESLVTLGAPTVFKKEYDGINKKLTGLIVKVENNKADKIEKDKKQLLKAFSALEVKSIKYVALHEADELKTKAKALKALKLAPKTYAKAVTVYQQSDMMISQDPYNKAKVDDVGKRALFAAKHALLVTERVIDLTVKYKKSPERVVLEEENRILSISQVFDQSDFRDQLIGQQVDAVIFSINQLTNENKANIARVETNDKQVEMIEVLEEQLATHKKNLLSSNETVDKLTTELAEREGMMVSMTADLLRSQRKEKELTALVLQQNIAAFEAKAEKNESVKVEAESVEVAAEVDVELEKQVMDMKVEVEAAVEVKEKPKV